VAVKNLISDSYYLQMVKHNYADKIYQQTGSSEPFIESVINESELPWHYFH
jgi:hypothetical protein